MRRLYMGYSINSRTAPGPISFYDETRC